MRMVKKIAILTGSRSEYGILYWVIKKMTEHPEVECQLMVTGSHLATSQGYTVNQIMEDGFDIAARIPMLLDGDDDYSTACSMGLGIINISKELQKLKPDILVLMGDRFEVFAAATAAMAMQVPIAHIGGGETDLANCLDGNIRNALTKMSHIHFVSAEMYADRLKAMGEEPWRIHNVGLPSLDHIDENLMTGKELEQSLGIKLKRPVFLATYLPVVLREEETKKEISALLEALSHYKNATVIFTLSNADAGGRYINEQIKEFQKRHENVLAVPSLGKQRYLSLMSMCDVVLGNSSSGIIEAPSFHCPVVNIGDRQAGRIYSGNVINVPGNAKGIKDAINKALFDEKFKESLKKIKNPFGQGDASDKIIETLLKVRLDRAFLEKKLNYQ